MNCKLCYLKNGSKDFRKRLRKQDGPQLAKKYIWLFTGMSQNISFLSFSKLAVKSNKRMKTWEIQRLQIAVIIG